MTRKYKQLLKNIGSSLSEARERAIRIVNTELVRVNWEIGRHIIEFEQQGKERADYGSELLVRLSKDLSSLYGKGFGRRNVLDMRRFYLTYQKWQAVPAKLCWTHFVSLLAVSDTKARKFYQTTALKEKWSYRELENQIDTSLYERMALSKNKKALATSVSAPAKADAVQSIIKDPYILEFLKIPSSTKMTEKFLEQKIIDNLQMFLLELGKGFAFVARQYRISLRNNHFYIDLVFYHRILKCFVLIDLKTRKVTHGDIGQMNLYLNYFKSEENVQGDNDPIGIILSAEKDEILVEFATGGLSNKIFVSKYRLYLPDKKQLQKEVKAVLESN